MVRRSGGRSPVSGPPGWRPVPPPPPPNWPGWYPPPPRRHSGLTTFLWLFVGVPLIFVVFLGVAVLILGPVFD